MSATLLLRFLPWFNRSMWIAAGLLCGMLAAHWLALWLETASPSPPFEALHTDRSGKARELSDYSIILERNLFGVKPGTLQGETADTAARDVRPTPGKAPGDIALLGTVAGGETPLALILVNRELYLLRLGDELPGGGILEEVRRSEIVVVLGDGGRQIVPLQEGESTTALSPQVRPPQARSASSPYQVESLGDNRWRIPSSEAQRARDNLNALLKTARMTPNIVDGRTEGFQVVTVQPRSLLAQMGLRPRDVLRQINGVELDSPEKALQIFYQLREARSLSLSLERNGEPLTFDYVVD